MKVLIFVAFVATSIFAETPVGRQRYFVAQPAGQSGPYAPRGWKPDGPSLNLPERQNQPSVNVRYPQNIAPTEQQRQQPSQFAPFEVEIDFAPAISANSQRIDVQSQFQSQYREPNRVYGAPSVQIASPRETYGPPVQQHNINLDNQYGVPPQGRFNVPNNQQFGAVPQQELTPPSLSNNPIVFNPTPTQQSSKLSNPTNPYEAPKQSQYIPPSFDNQYNVPVNQFDSPNKQSPYQPSATNAQEFNSPNKQPFGINNENDNEYRVPAKQQFGVGPNIQDQFNEPGQDEFGVQNPQTSNREPKFENDQRNTNPRNPNGVPNQYPLNQNNVPANPNNRFGPRNPSYSFGSRNPQNNFGSPSHRNPVGSQNPQNQFGNDNGQYPRVPDTRYGAPPNQYQTPRFGIPNPESNNFNSPRPQYKDEELTTTEESTSTDEIESTTVLAQSESEEENTSDEFSEEIEDAAKPRQSTKLAKPQRGEYYVSLPDGRLQRVRYISQQDIEAMRYFAKIRAENVEPLRGPIYAYAPLQEIKIGSESSSPESLSVSASELKPQSTDVDGGKVDAIKPLAQVQYQLDNPAGFLLPLTTSYSTLLANYANSPNEERLIVAIP